MYSPRLSPHIHFLLLDILAEKRKDNLAQYFEQEESTISDSLQRLMPAFPHIPRNEDNFVRRFLPVEGGNLGSFLNYFLVTKPGACLFTTSPHPTDLPWYPPRAAEVCVSQTLSGASATPWAGCEQTPRVFPFLQPPGTEPFPPQICPPSASRGTGALAAPVSLPLTGRQLSPRRASQPGTPF